MASRSVVTFQVVRALADEVTVMRDGKVLEQGEARHLLIDARISSSHTRDSWALPASADLS